MLHRVKEQRNILHTIKIRKVNWVDHVLRKNCHIKHVIEGKIEGWIGTGIRRGRRLKQSGDGLKERGVYCKLKDGALITLGEEFALE
jgi:hypothetical protein